MSKDDEFDSRVAHFADYRSEKHTGACIVSADDEMSDVFTHTKLILSEADECAQQCGTHNTGK